MDTAYYSDTLDNFLRESEDSILGKLANHHPHDLVPLQRNAWIAQIKILQRELRDGLSGWIAFEFSIPRMGKRADVILIYGGIIFVIEFKIGADTFEKSAIEQVTDYALDLKNFHVASHSRHIIPILIATSAESIPNYHYSSVDNVASIALSNGKYLLPLMDTVAQKLSKQAPLDPITWASSSYRPTPTIIEAAQTLYRNHRVEDITRSDAAAQNLGETTRCLGEIIDAAKREKKKAICFVTGVPGAGKTLCGLNLVTDRTNTHTDEHAVFLSGNGPLVEVLREALARDERRRAKEHGIPNQREASLRKIKSFIQPIHHFRDASLRDQNPPIERVAIFDEAQRAWDQPQLSKFMTQKKGMTEFEKSEPEFLIEVMDRHQDWCVIVCLVGGGQEINTGEAGLVEWFSAIERRFRNWRIFVSETLSHPDYQWGQDLKAMLAGLDVQDFSSLHLSVSIRSFRTEKQAALINLIINSNKAEANRLYCELRSVYPIALTRNLDSAKSWLREKARGSERFGLLASSGAHRLKPDAINVRDKIDAKNWFLSGKDDVRSSFYLEDVATEFDIQGLEVDWAGLCWDADLRHIGEGWTHHHFRGTKWQSVNDERRKTYLSNAYRVLLTRARQGLVVYVPQGSDQDPTRLPEFYDGVYEFLKTCGLEDLA